MELAREIHYNRLRPFGWAWKFYFLAFILFAAYHSAKKRVLHIAGVSVLCLGNVEMGTYLFKPTETLRIQQHPLYVYRAVQIGVVLLAAAYWQHNKARRKHNLDTAIFPEGLR